MKKSKPLHFSLYQKSPEIGAVIHTHSSCSVLLSFLPARSEYDCIPPLLSAFQARIHNSSGFLLKQHGPVVPGKTIMDAFFALEELEESARIAWELYRAGLDR